MTIAPPPGMGYFHNMKLRLINVSYDRSLRCAALALLVAASGLLGPAALAEKGYYKWMDPKGNPQHSDRPPPTGVEYEFISTDTGLSRRVSAEESRTRANPDTDNAPPPTGGAPADTGDSDQVAIEKDPALCDQARANLDTLQSKARVRIRDDQGIRYLTEEEKEVQRQKARDLIAVHCN
jgi:hypothetical protein